MQDPVNEAVGRLHELADEAERKRTHPTPSGSQGPMDSGDASSTRNKDAVRHTPRKHLPPRGAGIAALP